MEKSWKNSVLKKISPSAGERAEFDKRTNSILGKIKVKNAKAMLGGSGAKGTWLSGVFDTDIFVCFDYEKFADKSSKLSDILYKSLKGKFKIKRINGSRDYFQINDKTFTFEIIPILEIRKAEQAKNIMDVSMLHAGWVNKKLKNKKSIADEIRLMKAFCKARNVYGAESYIKGFSGYVCEILAVYYGSFLGILKNSVKWKEGQLIDVERHFRNKNVFIEVNLSKLQSPLIVIDPVQRERNAAAALSPEKFNLFRDSAERFLKSPSCSFFIKKEIGLEDARNKAKAGRNALVLEVSAMRKKKDVAGAKLLKAFEHIKKSLEENGFKIFECGWEWKKKALFWFILENKPPKARIIKGPPLKFKKHAAVFRKAHRNIFIKRGRLYAREARKSSNPEKLVSLLAKEDYLGEKVKSIRIIC